MKILFLLPRVPYPTEKGDKLRAYNHLKQLSKKHEVILCALNDDVLHEDAEKVLSQYAKSIYILPLSKLNIIFNLIKTFFSDKPFQVGYFYNRSTAKKIDAIIAHHKPDHIFCQLVRVAAYVKDCRIPKTLDYQDVFSKGVERRIATSSILIKPFLRLEYQRMLKYENMVFDKFDNKVIISAPDRDLIPHPQKEQIVVAQNGVDTSFFKPMESEKSYDLVFTGNMGYPPNINAAEFLGKEILPRVIEKNPGTTLLIAGASPHLRVSVLQSENIDVSGWVQDMRECYASARIFIAPMQIGTGLQNKLLEAMAMKIPCITSPLANQALKAKENIEILVAETPEDYARHILSLLNDKNLAEKIAQNGYDFVIKNFSWEKEVEKIDALITKK